MQTKAHFSGVMTRGKNMTLTHQISRRLALALVASASLFSSVGIAAADKIKVAAIYTLPVEQQWISPVSYTHLRAHETG